MEDHNNALRELKESTFNYNKYNLSFGNYNIHGVSSFKLCKKYEKKLKYLEEFYSDIVESEVSFKAMNDKNLLNKEEINN
jgi:hypothetical protein